jgi:hypothetical protein
MVYWTLGPPHKANPTNITINKPDGSYWDSIKDDYKKENPDIKIMGDKIIR